MNFLLTKLSGDPLLLVVIQATILMGIAFLLGLVLAKSAAARSCVFLSALACTFVGPVILLACSLTGYTFALPLPEALPEIPTETRHFASETEHLALFREHRFEIERLTSDVPKNETTNSHENDQKPVDIRQSPFSTRSWLLILWASGSLFSGLGIALSTTRLSKLLGTVEPVSEERIHSAAQRAAANLGIDEFPRVGISSRVHSPVAVGLAGPAWVLLTEHCLHAMSQDQLVQVLTHEGAHVVHRDPLIRLAQRIHLALWWWNPLAHFLNCQLSRSREELCDNVVLGRTEADEYGTTLFELGKLLSSEKCVVGSVGLFGSRWSLEHRIQGLLNPRRKTMIQVNRAVGAIVLAAFIGVTTVTSVTRIEAKESPASDQDRPIRDRKFEDLRIADRDSEARQDREHMALHRQLDHLTAAYRHLKAAGLEELAQKIGQRAEAVGKKVEQGHPHPGQSDRARRRYRNPLSDSPKRTENLYDDDRKMEKEVLTSLRHIHLELRDLRRDVDKLQNDQALRE